MAIIFTDFTFILFYVAKLSAYMRWWMDMLCQGATRLSVHFLYFSLYMGCLLLNDWLQTNTGSWRRRGGSVKGKNKVKEKVEKIERTEYGHRLNENKWEWGRKGNKIVMLNRKKDVKGMQIKRSWEDNTTRKCEKCNGKKQRIGW